MSNNIIDLFRRKKKEERPSPIHDKIESHLRKFCKGMRGCEVCNGNRWSMTAPYESAIYKIPDKYETGITTFFLMICEGCGNTKFFNCPMTGIKE